MKITSTGYLDGFYGKPRVDLDYISGHSNGLIALTACFKGAVPTMLLKGRMDEARSELGRLREIFSEDLYVEIMDHGLPEQGQVNPELVRLADKMEIPIIATNDCHYMSSDDTIAHDVLLRINTKAKLSDEKRFRFSSDQFWFKTQDEMAALFPAEYLTQTLEVAEKCNLELDLSTSHMPQFTTPDGSMPEEYLWRRIEEGITGRYGGELDTVRQGRIQREYDIICKTGFASYFLIVDDALRYAREQGIPWYS